MGLPQASGVLWEISDGCGASDGGVGENYTPLFMFRGSKKARTDFSGSQKNKGYYGEDRD